MVYSSNIEDMFGSHAVWHNVLSIVEKALEPLANPVLLHMVYSLDLPIEHGASSEDIYCYGEIFPTRRKLGVIWKGSSEKILHKNYSSFANQ
jgi:hypothetical protein